jgi:hypothetical protein
MSVAEIRMLYWIYGNIRRYQIRNDDVQEKLGVVLIQEKLAQHHMRLFDHIHRRSLEAPVRNDILSHPKKI